MRSLFIISVSQLLCRRIRSVARLVLMLMEEPGIFGKLTAGF